MLSQLLFTFDGHGYYAKVDRRCDPPMWTVSIDHTRFYVVFAASPDDAATEEFLRRLAGGLREAIARESRGDSGNSVDEDDEP